MSDPKPTYHHGDLRAALIEAATEIITENGVDAITMRGLATRVGVSRTAPYRHFDDKMALLAAVAVEGYRRLTEKMEAAEATTNLSVIERCQQMGQAYMLFAVENATHYRLMFGDNALDLEASPNLREAARASYKALLSIVKLGQAEQGIVDSNPHDIAFLLWSTSHGVAQLIIDGYLPLEQAERMAAFVTNTVTFGLLPRD